MEVNQDPTRRVIYMYERYIHKNYQLHNDSLFDLNDEQYMDLKAIHKGRRFCFIGEIIDEDQTLLHVPEEDKSESFRAHFMLDTFE